MPEHALTGVPGPLAAAGIYGIDVSAWQERVDWHAARAAGILFAFVKATESTGVVDAYLPGNRAGMAEAGLILRGLYHFARPDRNSAVDEASHFLAVVGQLDRGEVPVLDLETGNIGLAETGAWALTWLQLVEERTGRTPWIYSNAGFLAATATADLVRFPLWISGWGLDDGTVPPDDYRPSTDRWPSATVWQYTSKATVPGVDGYVDGDLFEGSTAELAALAAGIVTVPGLDHLHPVFAEAVAAACRRAGTSVYSGARSTAEQAELYRRWLAGQGAPANKPGTSWHEYGPDLLGGPWAVAVDFAEPYPHGEPGLIFPVPGEPWHAQPPEIPETARVAGAEDRLPTPTPTPPPTPEEPEVSKIAYPLSVDAGETRKLPVIAIGGGFGWTRASVTFASSGVDVRRAVVGPSERPITDLAPEGIESSRHFDGRSYVDLRPGDEWVEITLDGGGGTLDLYVEAADA